MTAPRITGLDLSLTRTGVALADGRYGALPTQNLRGCERMAWIRTHVLAACGTTGDLIRDMFVADEHVDLVVIEGFSYGSKNQRSVHEIGGLGWVIRLALYDAKIPYVNVPPAVLKKYATGRGNADKQAMQMAAVKRLCYDDDRPNDNAIDALWLRAVALEAYGHPLVELPAAQRAAVQAVEWPDLTESVGAVRNASAAVRRSAPADQGAQL